MQKYIHKTEELPRLFEKLKYETEKYWAIYSAMLFEIKGEGSIAEFREFILKYVRITDSLFDYSDTKILLILEETTIRWALLLENNLKEKIKDKWFSYNYFCSAIQWDYIETDIKLIKALKKRLKIAKEQNLSECVYNLES